MRPKLSQPPRSGKFVLPDVILCDRRPTLTSYAGQLRAYGAEFEEIHQALLKANRERCEPPLTDPHDLKGLKRLALWASKREKTTWKPHLSEDDARLLARWLHHVENHFPLKKGNRSAKKVARAVLENMRDGSLTTIDSANACRDAALAAGVSYPTAARALRSLSAQSSKERHPDIPVVFARVKDKHLREFRDGRNPIRHAYTYSVTKEPPRCTCETHLLSSLDTNDTCFITTPLPSYLHDAFQGRGKGLTKSAADVYDTLPVKTKKEAQEKTRYSKKTTIEAFKSLENQGLIEQIGGYWVRTEKGLDEVAKELGTTGTVRARVENYAEDKENYREWLSDPQRKKKLKIVLQFEGEVTDEYFAGLRETYVDFPAEESVTVDSPSTSAKEEGEATPPGDIFVGVVVDLFPGAQVVETRDMQACSWHRKLEQADVLPATMGW